MRRRLERLGNVPYYAKERWRVALMPSKAFWHENSQASFSVAILMRRRGTKQYAGFHPKNCAQHS